MTGPRRVVLCYLLLAGVTYRTCQAAATLPQDVRQTTSGQSVKAQVEKFIEGNLTKVTSDDPAAVKEGRDGIIAEVQQPTPTAPAPSDQFLDVYAEVLNKQLQPLAKSDNFRVRLNIAIIAARVAEKAHSVRLSPVVTDLLADQNEAVVIWAVKASRFLIPPILSNAIAAKTDKLLPELNKAVTKYIKSPPVVQAAYEALNVQQSGPNPVGPASWNLVVPIVVEAIHGIIEQRLKLYDNGVAPGASSESAATNFLISTPIWGLKGNAQQNEAQRKQQLRTVQLMSNLISAAGQRAGSASSGDKTELYDLIKKAVGGLIVVLPPEFANDENIKKLRGIGNSTPPADVATLVDAVYPLLKKVKQFESLTPPPRLSTVAPPATTTSSAPEPAP